MVKSSLKKIVVWTLGVLAQGVLAKYKPRIVAVTGGVGKTSTKDAVFTVLSNFFYSARSRKSYNSELGLPLAILGEESGWGNPLRWAGVFTRGLLLIVFRMHYPKWLVLEAGVDRPGDMDRANALIKSDVVVITALPKTPPHIEFFVSNEELFKEKLKLAKSLKKDGVFILNADDENVMKYGMAIVPPERRIITYGFADGATVRGSEERIIYDDATGFPTGVSFNFNYAGNVVPVKIAGALGRGHTLSALAGISAGIALDLGLLKIAESFRGHETPPGRMKLVCGVNGSLIIDDTYNASPEAARLALETFAGIPARGKKIVVLGDMLELGEETIPSHEKVGRDVPKGVALVVLVGQRAKYIANTLDEAGIKKSQVKFYDRAEQAGRYLSKKLEKGDIVLVKGSQYMRLEKVVYELMEEKDLRKKYLVRQDADWENR